MSIADPEGGALEAQLASRLPMQDRDSAQAWRELAWKKVYAGDMPAAAVCQTCQPAKRMWSRVNRLVSSTASTNLLAYRAGQRLWGVRTNRLVDAVIGFCNNHRYRSSTFGRRAWYSYLDLSRARTGLALADQGSGQPLVSIRPALPPANSRRLALGISGRSRPISTIFTLVPLRLVENHLPLALVQHAAVGLPPLAFPSLRTYRE
jgi:hypothetical protein